MSPEFPHHSRDIWAGREADVLLCLDRLAEVAAVGSSARELHQFVVQRLIAVSVMVMW